MALPSGACPGTCSGSSQPGPHSVHRPWLHPCRSISDGRLYSSLQGLSPFCLPTPGCWSSASVGGRSRCPCEERAQKGLAPPQGSSSMQRGGPSSRFEYIHPFKLLRGRRRTRPKACDTLVSFFSPVGVLAPYLDYVWFYEISERPGEGRGSARVLTSMWTCLTWRGAVRVQPEGTGGWGYQGFCLHSVRF